MIRIGALFATALLAGCWPPCDDAGYDTTNTFFVRETDATYATDIAECFDNDFSCAQFCVDLLGPPPAGTIRTITECYVVRDGAGGLTVHARSHLVQKCEDDWGWGGDDGLDDYPDAWREQIDARPPDAAVYDAEEVVDAAPPDAAL